MNTDAKYCPVCRHPLENKYCKLCHAVYYIQVEICDVDSPLLVDDERE